MVQRLLLLSNVRMAPLQKHQLALTIVMNSMVSKSCQFDNLKQKLKKIKNLLVSVQRKKLKH